MKFLGLTDHIFDEVRSFRLGEQQSKKETQTESEMNRANNMMCHGIQFRSPPATPATPPPVVISVMAASTASPTSSNPAVATADFSGSSPHLSLNIHHRDSPIQHQMMPSDAIDDICWTSLVSWLVPSVTPLPDSTGDSAPLSPLAFFIPCSDKDVRLLAQKKSAVISTFSTTATGTASSDSSIMGNRDNTKIRSDGGCHRSSTLNKEVLATSRILCPSSDTVAACRKPQIRAVSGMGCFLVPNFLLLTSDVCLSEVQAFCEVEYPVMFKVIMFCALLLFWFVFMYMMQTLFFRNDAIAGNDAFVD